MAQLRDDEVIEEEFNEVLGYNADNSSSRYPAMTYEKGVEAALAWVLGERDEPPFTEED